MNFILDNVSRRDDAGVKRHHVACDAMLSIHGLDVPVIVTNISQRGCRVTSRQGVPIRGPISLKFGAALSVKANVIWVRGRRVGCRFTSRIREEVLEAVISTPGSSPA